MSSQRRHAGTAYVVTPESGRGPGVMIIHDWWGLTPEVRQMADRLADAGFVALAPDLFNGEVADDETTAQRLLAESDPNESAALLMSSASALHGLPATTGTVGVVGLAMGASWGLWLATRVPELVSAVSAFYGTTDRDPEPGRAAIQCHFAEVDELVTEDQRIWLQSELMLLGRTVEVHDHPGTSHGFLHPNRPAYEPEASGRAWDLTVDFLHRHLDDEPAAASDADAEQSTDSD